MQSYILRKKFLDFFKDKKHKIIESDSLVPKDDPTVLFTPAGMNQFKKEFMGFDSGFKRAATSQRCLRTGDLDKVGKTCGHHTFFEMLGNFSFGDYFKKEAINWAWEFLTEELKIPKEKLWVSVYKDDDEAYKIWSQDIKVPEHKIVKLGDKENFWPSEAKEKGPNGPCGPCSEIFYDWGKDVGCKENVCDPSCSCGRFIEVWNLVFTQYNRLEGGKLESLPNKNIDTGMGLERLTAVMQGVHSNFETDLFVPVIKEIVGSLELGVLSREKKEYVFAIADHVRAVAFAIYDGVIPSNESRGYVVRKIIRKAVLHLKELGIEKPFLYKLIPVVASIMKPYYPELTERQENIADVILSEEKNFISILDNSPELVKKVFSGIDPSDEEASAKAAFELYDTHGIPVSTTSDLAIKFFTISAPIKEEKVAKIMEEQKERSKSQSTMKGDVFSAKDFDYGIKETAFFGYEEDSIETKIVKIIKDGSPVDKIEKDDSATIVVEKSVFYPESGGQIGDTGAIKGKEENFFTVLDTQKSGKVILLIGKVKSGSFKKNDSVFSSIDKERRLAIARNHTATHLLQAALRKVLGQHVQQQGSLVAEDKLRFDFTHFKGIDKIELDRIEEAVNEYIMHNISLETKQLSLAEAKKQGALAFFGEKYEQDVRVVTAGSLSKELCGGTHLEQTGQIGLFKIIYESSIASGVRRIEAVTGNYAYKIIKKQDSLLQDVMALLNVPADKLTQELQKKLKQVKDLEKQISSKELENVKDSVDELIQKAEVINNFKLITARFENMDMDLLRKTTDLIKQKADNCVIALGSVKEGKAFLVTATNLPVQEVRLDAGKLIMEIAPEIGGSGGGRKDFAQAGGNKPENLEAAFKKLKEIVAKIQS